MSNDTSVFCCTHCGARFKGPATAQKVRCVKCQKVVERTLSSSPPPIRKPSAGSPQATKASSSNAPGPPPQPEPLGFFGYCWHSYTDTHSTLPWLFAAILGLILIPVLSFSKPLLGIGGIWCAFGVTILLALFLFAILSMTACVKYLFGKQRQIPPDGDCTWLSATTCFLLTLSVALGVCAGVESFGPAKGILVALQPQLEKEQVRFFRDSSGNEPGAESVESNNGDHDATVSAAQKSSETPATEASEISRSKPVRDQEKKTTPKKEQTQEVIAEGVGATTDEAVKDAYRNAVRQVVGAVVDAETLVKNDEIIDDKVLTYSDGFIKDYEEVDGSKNVKGGLHRIKIKAQVERRSVIAKLKAANVTVKEVDGKGLFAEAVTQLDAEKDAAALLQKQFEGFPQSCITATVIGEPKLVSQTGETGTVKITVQIEPDLKAYKAFSGKLVSILDKLAKEKGEFTAKYQKIEHVGLDYMETSNRLDEWMPKLLTNPGAASSSSLRWKAEQVAIAVAVNRTKSADSLDYKYYSLDPSLETVLRRIAFRSGQCKLQLLDAEGAVVITYRFDLYEKNSSYNSDHFYGSLVATGMDYDSRIQLLARDELDNYKDHKLLLLFIAPVFGDTTRQKTRLTLSRSPTLSLDELKSVKDAKVEITFDE